MKHFLWGTLTVALLVCGLVAFKPSAVQAATPEGFNLITSPLPIKLSTTPGQTVETELRLKNQGTQPEDIKIGLMKFGATGESGVPNLFDLTPKDTYASWVHFSPQQFTAQPNVWMSVKMTINVPPEAGLGYYMAVTFSRASQPGAQHATNLKGAVATLVLLDIKSPNEQRHLKLVDFTASHGLYEYLPASFSVKLHNSGNIYIAPTGNIFISRGGKPTDTVNFNEAGGSVLPGSNRVIKATWTNGFPVYKDRIVDGKPVIGAHAIPKQDLKWDFTHLNKFRIGHYTAKLLAVYDDGKQDVPIEASVGFWVVPWKLFLMIIAALVLLDRIFVLIRLTLRKARGRVAKPGKPVK